MRVADPTPFSWTMDTAWCRVGERALYTDKRSQVGSICTIDEVDLEETEFVSITITMVEKQKEVELAQLSPVTSNPSGKTVVFDFDQTLTEVFAAGGSPLMLANPVEKIFGGAERVALLDAFLQKLKDAGVTLV